MTEFELIARHFAGLPAGTGTLLGIGDDAALLHARPGEVLAHTTDTLVEGRHFAPGADAEALAHKLVAVNLSDLAAMGAEPAAVSLALTLPEANETWLSAFARGLGLALSEYGIGLIGGDTTRGPLTLTLSALGWVPEAAALRRSGARVGDLVAVTGTLGDAAAALALGPEAPASLAERLHRPRPRVAAGLTLRGRASAAIDVSDGLLADLGHVCRLSGVGADLREDLLPASETLMALAATPEQRRAWQASGGDDYELCVTLPPERVNEAVAALAAQGLPLTVIGRVRAGQGVRLLSAEGEDLTPSQTGYRHF